MHRTKTVLLNPIEHLNSDEEMAAYMEAALADGNQQVIAMALEDIAITQRMKSRPFRHQRQ